MLIDFTQIPDLVIRILKQHRKIRDHEQIDLPNHILRHARGLTIKMQQNARTPKTIDDSTTGQRKKRHPQPKKIKTRRQQMFDGFNLSRRIDRLVEFLPLLSTTSFVSIDTAKHERIHDLGHCAS